MNTRDRKKRLREINKEKHDLQEEREVLKYDLERVGTSIETGSKLDSNESTLLPNLRTYYDFKEDYPAFFESDSNSEGEKEGPSSRPGKIMQIKSYIKNELKINGRALAKLQDEENLLNELAESNFLPGSRQEKELLERGKSSKKTTDSLEEESKILGSLGEAGESSKQTRDSFQIGESSKRKSDSMGESDDSSSSKKSRQTPNDFIDSLPELPYNPFDD